MTDDQWSRVYAIVSVVIVVVGLAAVLLGPVARLFGF